MKQETAMAAAMSRAGFNTAAQRLRQLVIDAMQKAHGNKDHALRHFTAWALEDRPVNEESLRRSFEAELPSVGRPTSDHQRAIVDAGQPNGAHADHKASDSHAAGVGAAPENASGAGQSSIDHHSNNARPFREPSAADRAAIGVVQRQIAISVFDRVKTSDGRAWGNVGAHELSGMSRDGAIAAAVESRLGVLTNEQRFLTLRELMRPDDFDAAVREARERGRP